MKVVESIWLIGLKKVLKDNLCLSRDVYSSFGYLNLFCLDKQVCDFKTLNLTIYITINFGITFLCEGKNVFWYKIFPRMESSLSIISIK